MRSASVAMVLVIALSVAAPFLFPGRGTAQVASQQLPGARPAIDAAQYPSLQAALDALPSGGGKVVLPAGEFAIKEPLLIRTEDVCLEGAGTGTLIRNLNEQGQPTLLLAHPEAKDARGAQQHKLWRIRLANFRLVGNAKSGHGIEARGINELFIQGVTVSEHGGDGIHLNLCYEDPRVSDSLITYNKGTGLNLLGCHDIVVSANQFEENQDALHCFDGFNLCMTGNCVDDHLGRGVVIENTYGSVVSGNMIEECQAAAVVLDRDCYGIAISANVIAHNGAGIELLDAHGCAVSANALTLMKTDAVRLAKDSGRIAVSGNSFSNSDIGEGKVKRGTDDLAAAGLVLDGAGDVGISGNVFSGLTTKAVTVTPLAEGASTLFADNVLVEVDSDHRRLQNSVDTGNLWNEKAK